VPTFLSLFFFSSSLTVFLTVFSQKLQHLRSSAEPDAAKRESYHSGWVWKVGLSLVVFGSVADFAALSFAPQSLVAPLGSLTLVSNVIFAPLLLKETVSRLDLAATATIIAGSVIAVSFASHSDQVFTYVPARLIHGT
jgi:drug/metabolite transporter (DMT)-like permease